MHSNNHRWATALDIVAYAAHGGAGRVPRVIECKTTGLSAERFRALFDIPDKKFKTLYSQHLRARTANSTRRRYMDQLCNGMNMYHATHAAKDAAPADMAYGTLLIVCSDAIIEYTCDFRYEPGTGINVGCAAESGPSSSNSRKRARTPAPARRSVRRKGTSA